MNQSIYDDETWDVFENKTIDLSDKKIGGFPEILANTKLSYRWNNLFASVQVQYVGKQYLDNTENEDRVVDAYQLINLGLNYELTSLFNLADISFNLKVNNLLNNEYKTSGYHEGYELYSIDSNQYYHWGENFYFPGAGRNIIAGIRMGF